MRRVNIHQKYKSYKNRNHSETIKIDISVYPPSEMNYKDGTDKLAALMKEHRIVSIVSKKYYMTQKNRELSGIFKEKLPMLCLKYDVEHIYTITMTLLKNGATVLTPVNGANFTNGTSIFSKAI